MTPKSHRRPTRVRRLTAREWLFATIALAAFLLGSTAAYATTSAGKVACQPATVGADGGFNLKCKVVMPNPTGSPTPTASPSVSPTVTPSPTPTPTPTGSPTGPVTGCVALPLACAYPDAFSTGPYDETNLTPITGALVVTVDGTVVDSVRVTGCVDVRADNVTIRNSIIDAAGCFWAVRNLGGGLVVEDSEISCGGGNGTGLGSQFITVVRSDIHGCENGLDVSDAGHVTVRDSYIHDMTTCCGAHTDGLQLGQGVEFVLIDHNTIIVPAPGGTSAIIMWDEGDPQNRNILVSGNLLAGGTWTLYCPRENSTNVRVINNRFGPYQYGSANSCIPGHVAEFSGNVEDATGLPLGG